MTASVPASAVADEVVEAAARALCASKGIGPDGLQPLYGPGDDEPFDAEDAEGRRYAYAWRAFSGTARTVLEAALPRLAPATAHDADALRKATLELLGDDETDCFVGTHWVKPIDPAFGTWPVLCVTMPSYGADAEEVPDEEIVPLARLVKEFGSDAAVAWACHRRGLDKPVKGDLTERGKAALASLRGEPKQDGGTLP